MDYFSLVSIILFRARNLSLLRGVVLLLVKALVGTVYVTIKA